MVAGVVGAIGAVVATKSGEANLEKVFVWSALFAAMLRFATPLLFGALGGIMSERSGVINVGLEGMMLMGAFFGIFGADVFGSWFLGVLVGVAAGGVLGVRARGLLDRAARRPGGERRGGQLPRRRASPATSSSRTTATRARPARCRACPDVTLPLIKDIAVHRRRDRRDEPADLGGAAARAADGALPVPDPGGLRLRSVGEKPRAADSVGIPVLRTRYLAVIASGCLAGLGGVYLSVGAGRTRSTRA